VKFGVAGQPIVVFDGHVIVGFVVSTTVTDWLAVTWLLPQSVAVHVRVFTYVPAQEPGVVVSTKLSDGFAQLSETVGLLNAGVAGHSMVAFAPTPLMTGGIVSVTVNACVQFTVLLPF
jgi:hypothetical protein